jgi:hypothetical protein
MMDARSILAVVMVIAASEVDRIGLMNNWV